MSIVAYRKVAKTTDTPRAIERRLLVEVTTRLAQDAAHFDDGTPAQKLQMLSQGLGSAIARNQTLWYALAADVASPGNGLPPATRAGILSIATWMERESSKVMSGRGKVAAIADVNRAITLGLEGTGSLTEASC